MQSDISADVILGTNISAISRKWNQYSLRLREFRSHLIGTLHADLFDDIFRMSYSCCITDDDWHASDV